MIFHTHTYDKHKDTHTHAHNLSLSHTHTHTNTHRWLEGPVDPGRWAVVFRGSAVALPVCVGRGGVHEICYPPLIKPLSRFFARESGMSMCV